MRFKLPCFILSMFLTIASSYAFAVQTPQYGFAHRVNDWDQIDDALSSDVNAIELDICYSSYKEEWYVSHNDANTCWTASAESLAEWMGRLKSLLNANPSYNDKFTMLWIDVKTPSEDNLMNAVNVIRQYVPANLWVMYDLTNFGDEAKTGFERIYYNLKQTEGISFSAPNQSNVQEIYDYFKQKGFKRGGINHGHSIDINEEILTTANNLAYHQSNDPYRFKKVFTWTNRNQSSMQDYIDPSHSYHTDGQIVGEWGTQWASYMSYIATDFKNAVNVYSSTRRLADRNDNPWALSYIVELKSPITHAGTGNSMCIDINTWDPANNSDNAQLWECNHTGGQQFVYTPHLQSLSLRADPSYCLDVSGGSTADGTNVQLWRCNGTNAQKFEYRLGDQTLRSLLNTNKCVDVNNGGNTNGTNIQIYSCNGSNPQKFTMMIGQGAQEPLVEFKSALTAGNNAKCIDISGWSPANNGDNAQLWDCNLTGGQQFIYDPASGMIKLKADTSYCLDVSGGGTADGTNIQLWGCNNTNAQKFEYRVGSNTLHSLLNTNMCVDVSFAGTANGTNIQLWSCNYLNAQKFSME